MKILSVTPGFSSIKATLVKSGESLIVKFRGLSAILSYPMKVILLLSSLYTEKVKVLSVAAFSMAYKTILFPLL